MSTQDRAAVVFTGCALMLVALWFVYEPPAPAPILSPTTQRTADSLVATGTSFHASIDTAAEARRLRDLELVALRRRMKAAEDSTTAAKRRADSAAAIAQTAEQWKAAHDLRSDEVTRLRTESAQKDTTIGKLEQDTASLRIDLRGALQRVAAHEDLQARVSMDIAEANKRMECAILTWPKRVRCPTRKEAAIGGALVGVIAGAKAARN